MSLVIVPGSEWSRSGIGTTDYVALTSTVLKSETSQVIFDHGLALDFSLTKSLSIFLLVIIVLFQRREEAVAHLVMGPRHHSLEDIEREIGTVPPVISFPFLIKIVYVLYFSTFDIFSVCFKPY